jgi:hypothetical protein
MFVGNFCGRMCILCLPEHGVWAVNTKTPGQRFAILVLQSLLLAGFLRAAGQPWHCQCRSLAVWSGNVVSSHNSQHLLDPYSLTHVLHGVLLAGLLWFLPRGCSSVWRFGMAACVEAGWELMENSPLIIERYRTATISLHYYGDSVVNSCGDLLACMAGFVIAERIGLKRSVVLFAVTELLLIVWIRDCLVLNVLMLLCPVDAIRVWQARGLN